MIQPLDDRVLVRRNKPVDDPIIVLTDQGPSQLAIVLAVGPGRRDKNGRRRPMEVAPGDVVLVPGIANQFPDWLENEELLIQEADIGLVMKAN